MSLRLSVSAKSTSLLKPIFCLFRSSFFRFFSSLAFIFRACRSTHLESSRVVSRCGGIYNERGEGIHLRLVSWKTACFSLIALWHASVIVTAYNEISKMSFPEDGERDIPFLLLFCIILKSCWRSSSRAARRSEEAV